MRLALTAGCISIVALLSLVGCRRQLDRATPEPHPKSSESEPTWQLRAAKPVPAPQPQRLLASIGSAYAATLAVDDGTGYLLTSDAAYRLAPGGGAVRWPLALGHSAGLMPGKLVFWSGGSFQSVPTHGGEPTLLARVPHEPQRLVISQEHFAWLDQQDEHFAIKTLDGPRVRVVARPSGSITALAMQDDLIYFVERARDLSWRFGVVSLSGGAPEYTSQKQGRTPAMLSIAGDLFYYDGPSLSVRRVSPDLHEEIVIARDVICSPMFVAEQLYCAQPGGIIELDLGGGARRTISLADGTITAIRATASELIWLTDIGGGRLAVDSLALESEKHALRGDLGQH